MRLELKRFKQDAVTFGKLYLNGYKNAPDIYTLELPWRDNKRNISCIPQGLYNVVPHNTNKYPKSYRLLNVPDREGILIHEGNFASSVKFANRTYEPETKGCILVGFDINESIPMVGKSQKCIDYLWKTIGEQNFSIEVINQF